MSCHSLVARKKSQADALVCRGRGDQAAFPVPIAAAPARQGKADALRFRVRTDSQRPRLCHHLEPCRSVTCTCSIVPAYAEAPRLHRAKQSIAGSPLAWLSSSRAPPELVAHLGSSEAMHNAGCRARSELSPNAESSKVRAAGRQPVRQASRLVQSAVARAIGHGRNARQPSHSANASFDS